MQWLALIPLAMKLIGFLETIWTEKGQGTIKKSVVMGALQAATEVGIAASTGGQQQTWTDMEKPVSQLVDAIVSTANAAGWTGIQDDSNAQASRSGL